MQAGLLISMAYWFHHDRSEQSTHVGREETKGDPSAKDSFRRMTLESADIMRPVRETRHGE